MLAYKQFFTGIQDANNSVQCVQSTKHLSWIYYNEKLKTIILIDPLLINHTYMSLIEKIQAENFFIVLTSCERKKKEYLHTWSKFYPFHVFLPASVKTSKNQKTFFAGETIYKDETTDIIYTPIDTAETNKTKASHSSKNAIAQIISSHGNNYDTLLVYIPPYLFSGTLLQEKSPMHTTISNKTRKYIYSLPSSTIVLPSLGQIATLAQ